jgi:putative glutamine amidotransferase
MAEHAPVIGITTYPRDPATGHYTLPSEYVSAVQRAGALPLLIPPGSENPERYLDLIDGLVLAGGGDVDPKTYGADPHQLLYNLDTTRDTLELVLARAVIERGVPTLGVCRGAQVVNIALGGTLIQHLPDVVGESVLHRSPPREPVPHAVSIKADSRLAAIVGELAPSPMSWHHQAIGVVAAGLDVVATAPDGTIEAVELRAHPWLIAVQWHPELTAAIDPGQQNLFDALAAAARL